MFFMQDVFLGYYLAHKYTDTWEVLLLLKCLSFLNGFYYRNRISCM